ncbi:MAG: hypothetical protein ACRCZ2_05765 [Fusobacteriaceae bacterium]
MITLDCRYYIDKLKNWLSDFDGNSAFFNYECANFFTIRSMYLEYLGRR